MILLFGSSIQYWLFRIWVVLFVCLMKLLSWLKWQLLLCRMVLSSVLWNRCECWVIQVSSLGSFFCVIVCGLMLQNLIQVVLIVFQSFVVILVLMVFVLLWVSFRQLWMLMLLFLENIMQVVILCVVSLLYCFWYLVLQLEYDSVNCQCVFLV